KKLDAGPVLGIRKVELTDDVDAVQLHDQLKTLGADLLHLEYMDYLRGHLIPIPQDETLVTVARKIEKSEVRIEWNRTAREIFKYIRGLAMGPFPYTIRNGLHLKIHQVRVGEESGEFGVPGEVLSVNASSFHVACSQGALEVLVVQPESRSRQTASDYMRGYPLQVGDRFE